MESNAWPFECSRNPRGIEDKYRIPDSSNAGLFCCEKEHRELSQEPQHRVSENDRAEELSNRATLEIMIDKIRQQLRLLPCYIKVKRSLLLYTYPIRSTLWSKLRIRIIILCATNWIVFWCKNSFINATALWYQIRDTLWPTFSWLQPILWHWK